MLPSKSVLRVRDRDPGSRAGAARGSLPFGLAPVALGVYAFFASATFLASYVRGTSPFVTEPWAELPSLPELARHTASVLGGAVLATGTIASTRAFVRRFGWARKLHADLRPSVRHSGDGTLVVLGFASGIAEELFFRGFLATTVGLVLSSLAFGLLHQSRGNVRFVWAAWATVMGLLFGALFLATGSLAGPIVAHVAINVANLRFLRDTDVEPKKPRRLGGLLERA